MPLTIEDFYISDDFESHTSFAINSPGEVGWTYIDGDGRTSGGFNGFDYPGETSAMAYIVFDPTAITSGSVNVAAHSGNKFLASPWVSQSANNDWIISPELNANMPLTLSFYACSYSSYYKESFKVAYSTNGTAQSDFSHIIDQRDAISATWTLYTYEIPAEAKYVAINCISNDKYMFCLDDISISGNLTSGVAAVNIYDNGVLIAENQSSGSYSIENIYSEEHCITLRAVCDDASLSLPTTEECVSETTDIETIDFNASIYPNPTKSTFTIECDNMHKVEVYNVLGQICGTFETSSKNIEIDASKWNNGIYSIRITTNDNNIVVKQLIKD
ncbi:MAG: T9SS type A sorting domain-containing protein [Bacteroidales bacterium]|nr:T9SS type A sorting domain-containing protein [Bacteroidales bacterium]